MNYKELLVTDLRLVILRTLEQIPGYSCNDSILHSVAKDFGHHVSRDQIRTQVSWLREQDLVTCSELETGTVVATATQRGIDAAQGNITVPGVKRPAPGA